MSEATEVAVLDQQRPLVPAVVFAPGGALSLVERIEAETRAIKTDISTAKGRDAVRSLAYKVTRSKTALDEMGKKLTDDARAKIDAVNADRRAIRDRLDALAAEVRAPLTAWEDAEKARVAEHDRLLGLLPEWSGYGQNESAADIASRLDYLRAYPARDWQEFRQRFDETLAREIERMEALHDAAVTREAEAAELARLRAEAAERERQEAARLQAEREAAIAAAAAEAARLEAERVAAEAAQAAAMEAERQAEAIRQAAAEEAERAARQAREAQEAAAAEVVRIEAEKRRAEDARIEAERRAAQAEEAQKAAAAQAEAAAQAAAAQAARDRAEAILAERSRIAAEAAVAEREAAARAADRAHRAQINGMAVAALVKVGLTEDQAKIVITAVVKGEVPHVAISY